MMEPKEAGAVGSTGLYDCADRRPEDLNIHHAPPPGGGGAVPEGPACPAADPPARRPQADLPGPGVAGQAAGAARGRGQGRLQGAVRHAAALHRHQVPPHRARQEAKAPQLLAGLLARPAIQLYVAALLATEGSPNTLVLGGRLLATKGVSTDNVERVRAWRHEGSLVTALCWACWPPCWTAGPRPSPRTSPPSSPCCTGPSPGGRTYYITYPRFALNLLFFWSLLFLLIVSSSLSPPPSPASPWPRRSRSC